MSKTQRTITIGLWALVVVSLMSLIAMMRLQSRSDREQSKIARQMQDGQVFEVIGDGQLVPATQRTEPYTFPAPSFKLTDQESQPFDSDSLRGKVWTASFFFSRCEGVCPGMMGRIHDLQKVTTDPNVHFVYLSVDPERDTPERLKEYALEAGADAARWHILSGSAAEVKRIATEFKKPYRFPAEHSPMIMLVDQKGTVVGWYDSRDNAAMLNLATDIGRLRAGEAVQ